MKISHEAASPSTVRMRCREILQRAACREDSTLAFETEWGRVCRAFRPPERLLLLGAGHVAQPTALIADLLGFSVWAADDRPEFVTRERFPNAARCLCMDFPSAIACFQPGPTDYAAVMTRGHSSDTECLRSLLAGPMPRYLGLIGSRRRTAALKEMLAAEGFDRAALDAIHTPIGLAIGAVTPREIAVSIAAELVSVRRSLTGRDPSVLEQEDTDTALLERLSAGKDQALVLVTETSGSVPTRAGALLLTDRFGRTAGTVGGGAGEAAAVRAARALIGTGKTEELAVDMRGDPVSESDLVCGGCMRLLIMDIANE